MSKKPESRLQLRLQKRLKAKFGKNCHVRKIHGNPFQQGGIQDLLCCIHGYFIAFETKIGNEELEDLQEQEELSVWAAGGVSWRVNDVDKAIRLTTAYLKKKRVNC